MPPPPYHPSLPPGCAPSRPPQLGQSDTAAVRPVDGIHQVVCLVEDHRVAGQDHTQRVPEANGGERGDGEGVDGIHQVVRLVEDHRAAGKNTTPGDSLKPGREKQWEGGQWGASGELKQPLASRDNSLSVPEARGGDTNGGVQ